MGLFDKIKQGLKKTAQILNTDVRDLFKSEGRLVDQVFLDELLGILIKTDMGVQSAQTITKVWPYGLMHCGLIAAVAAA